MEGLDDPSYDDLHMQQNAAYNLGDLKREEETLISLYSKMKDQLHKLEVEELELKQKIRRKELKETTADLFPPPAVPATEDSSTKKRTLSKGKSPKRRKRDSTLSTSHDETASEMDEAVSVTSGVSQPSPVKLTPTKRSPKASKDSPSKLKAARSLIIPSCEPEHVQLDLDLSALNSFSMSSDMNQVSADFVESEDEN